MSPQNANPPGKTPEIDIDYDHLDVARIMEGIKASVAGETDSAAAASDPLPFMSPPSRGGDTGEGDREPTSDAPPPPTPGRARRLALKLMSPFRPLIKLLILPVYDEFRQTVGVLHKANVRIDRLLEATDRDRHNAVVQLDRLREYTKLLHSLSHNLVVELAKLRIENDTLKARVEIMEKDFDFLGKRERALEREVLG